MNQYSNYDDTITTNNKNNVNNLIFSIIQKLRLYGTVIKIVMTTIGINNGSIILETTSSNNIHKKY